MTPLQWILRRRGPGPQPRRVMIYSKPSKIEQESPTGSGDHLPRFDLGLLNMISQSASIQLPQTQAAELSGAQWSSASTQPPPSASKSLKKDHASSGGCGTWPFLGVPKPVLYQRKFTPSLAASKSTLSRYFRWKISQLYTRFSHGHQTHQDFTWHVCLQLLWC